MSRRLVTPAMEGTLNSTCGTMLVNCSRLQNNLAQFKHFEQSSAISPRDTSQQHGAQTVIKPPIQSAPGDGQSHYLFSARFKLTILLSIPVFGSSPVIRRRREARRIALARSLRGAFLRREPIGRDEEIGVIQTDCD